MTRIRWVTPSVGLLCAGMSAQAQQPAQNISPARHSNLAGAQEAIQQAYNLTARAQTANQSQLGGHAERAKELLREAADELKAAATTLRASYLTPLARRIGSIDAISFAFTTSARERVQSVISLTWPSADFLHQVLRGSFHHGGFP
jgi:hypothetical protein